MLLIRGDKLALWGWKLHWGPKETYDIQGNTVPNRSVREQESPIGRAEIRGVEQQHTVVTHLSLGLGWLNNFAVDSSFVTVNAVVCVIKKQVRWRMPVRWDCRVIDSEMHKWSSYFWSLHGVSLHSMQCSVWWVVNYQCFCKVTMSFFLFSFYFYSW